MKSEVITIKTKIGLLTYLNYRTHNKGNEKNNHELKHSLNIKQALFNQYFTYYNPGMNFEEQTIISDKREWPNSIIETRAMTLEQIKERYNITQTEENNIKAIIQP